jgi:hypothetical protein
MLVCDNEGVGVICRDNESRSSTEACAFAVVDFRCHKDHAAISRLVDGLDPILPRKDRVDSGTKDSRARHHSQQNRHGDKQPTLHTPARSGQPQPCPDVDERNQRQGCQNSDSLDSRSLGRPR